MLISQETKYIDYLFGRADLALLTQQQADEDAHDYLYIFESVIEQLKGDNLWVPKSVYEQAAKVLPEILFRFTYKCSVRVLDELLDLLLKLCLSNRQTELPSFGSLLKELSTHIHQNSNGNESISYFVSCCFRSIFKIS